jgi:protein-disulfide isomerase
MNRRAFLAASVAGAATLAGCTGGSAGSGAPETSGGLPTDGGEDAPPHTHALDGLDSQPSLGPEPREADGLIVAFEDPSCPRCQAFEQQVFPQVRSDLIDPGKVSFVFRGYPVVYPWGEPACYALEATFARDEAAFWALHDHYFASAGEFESAGEGAVYDLTADFLNSETDVDGDAVIEDVEGEAVAQAVGTDLDAGRAAGVGRTTPTLFLFRNGEFLTRTAGSVSYTIIERTLDV